MARGYAQRLPPGFIVEVIQRQLGHVNLGVTSIYLDGIDTARDHRHGPQPTTAHDLGKRGTHDRSEMVANALPLPWQYNTLCDLPSVATVPSAATTRKRRCPSRQSIGRFYVL